MKADRDFPRLTPENHRVTSPPAIESNGIAWAAGDTEHWWQPGVYWPIDYPEPEYGIAAPEAAFRALGFESCDDAGPEVGFEKVALHGEEDFDTHAARQRPGGWWTSKLGKAEDIEHETPEVVAGGVYGKVVALLRRAARSEAMTETVT